MKRVKINPDLKFHMSVINALPYFAEMNMTSVDFQYGFETNRRKLNELADTLEPLGYEGTESGWRGSDTSLETITWKHPKHKGEIVIRAVAYHDHLGRLTIKGV